METRREVSWRIERGEHWAIIGTNSSGKASLLSALTGYLTGVFQTGTSAVQQV